MRDGHTFVPIDFETDTLQFGLDRAGLDWSQPTFFSSLGLTMYLTTEAMAANLRTVAACEPGSEIVLSYDHTDPFLNGIRQAYTDAESNLVASVVSPIPLRIHRPTRPRSSSATG